jgi:A/G-specific adenine glycosylase
MSHKNFVNLIAWSNDHYSDLPWRKERTLYRTLVSEIMLQQTTVGTVLNHFENFLGHYPTIFDLANTSEEEVCISWKGLGYYRRARSLRSLAIMIVEQFKGDIPTDLESLLKLRGIGPYTANAIVAIGADLPGLAVDANLERVLSRFYGVNLPKGAKLQQKILKDFSDQKILTEMTRLSPRKLNEAFMDLGRMVCQSRKTTCSLCPLQSHCVAYKSGNPLAFPIAILKKVENDLFMKLVRVVVRENEKILFYQKSEKEWLSGQWELPTFMIETNDESLKQYPKIKAKKSFTLGPQFKTSITKYKIENNVIEMPLKDFEKMVAKIAIDYRFKTLSSKLNATTATLKALKYLTLITPKE